MVPQAAAAAALYVADRPGIQRKGPRQSLQPQDFDL